MRIGIESRVFAIGVTVHDVVFRYGVFAVLDSARIDFKRYRKLFVVGIVRYVERIVARIQFEALDSVSVHILIVVRREVVRVERKRYRIAFAGLYQ